MDTDRMELRAGGRLVPLESRALALLIHLLESSPRVVSKAELFDTVWADVTVSEDALRRAVSVARRAVGGGERGATIVRTIRGRGYRLGVPVTIVDRPEQEARAPACGDVFVGRGAELAFARDALADVDGGRGRTILVSGAAGIGKTRLLEEIGRLGRERKAHVFWGRCSESDDPPLYWPWLQILRSAGRAQDAKTLALEMGAGAADLAKGVPEIGDPLTGLSTAPSMDPKAARFRFLDRLSTFLHDAARTMPLVLILDDLHRADASSLWLLAHLAHECSDARILIVGAYRDLDIESRPDLEATVAEILRARAAEPVRVIAGLTLADTIDFTSRLMPGGGSLDLAHAIHERSEGNPLFVRELLQHALRRPEPSMGAASLDLPPGIRRTLATRFAALDPACRELVSIGSVIGREFDIRVLAGAAGTTVAGAAKGLESAERLRIVEAVPDCAQRLRFTHALVRDALYDELAACRRLDLHHAVAVALEATSRHTEDPAYDRLAHHYAHAAPECASEKALHYSCLAGRVAMERFAFESAVRHFEKALSLIGPEPRDLEQRCRILLDLARAQRACGEPADVRRTIRRAIAAARAAASPHLLAEVAIEASTRTQIPAEPLRSTSEALEEALAALGPDDPMRARVLAALASDLTCLGDVTRALRLSEESLSDARRLGDGKARMDAAAVRYQLLMYAPGDERRQAYSERLRLARSTDDAVEELWATFNRLADRIFTADADGIESDLRTIAERVDRLRDPLSRATLAAAYTSRALWRGELDLAEKGITESRALYERTDPGLAAVVFGAQLFSMFWIQGRLSELEIPMRTMVDQNPDRVALRCLQALVHVEAGDPDRARRLCRELVLGGALDETLPWDRNIAVATLAEVASALGDLEVAAPLYERLLPAAGHYVAISTMATAGAADRYLGLLAALLGRAGEAAKHFEAALEIERRMGARPWEAMVLRDRARFLEKRGEARDVERGIGSMLGPE